MFNLINKKQIISELTEEKFRNEKYKKAHKNTKDGAMFLGREIALEEVIKRLNDNNPIDCEHTIYMIHWEEDNIEKSLRDILKRLKDASTSVDAVLLQTTKMIINEYIDGENIKLKND